MGFHVYQPGSSVVTSLIQAESKQKHIGLLEINLDKFRIVPIKLDTVRPFVFSQMELKHYADKIKKQEDVEKIIEEKLEEMLVDALNQVSISKNSDSNDYINEDIDSKSKRNLPILRIKIEFSGYQITRTNFIVSKFAGRLLKIYILELQIQVR